LNTRKENNKKLRKIVVLVGICIISSVILSQKTKESINTFIRKGADIKLEEEAELSKFQLLLEHLFDNRNKAILTKNDEVLKKLYDVDHKFGLWAYEQEITKMKYLENWSYKQGVKFNDIKTRVKVRKVKEKEENLYGIICAVSTEYNYSYENQLDTKNMFRIGTYHYLNMRIIDNEYIITKEWYTDPFADSLHLDNIKSDDIRSYIMSKENVQTSLTNEQVKAIEYAHKYCGAAADEEHGMKFNTQYKDFNPDGGDCANFASQIMYESKRFKKNKIWNYEGNAGTKAWVNAQGFKNYLLNSGRGSLICKGSFEEVYKMAYNMVPGDIVAYEKGGRITHVSTVTGVDSKGYPLVTCHNTDRLLVPWDLGWSNKSIKFHLIKVHY
jgi:hypothetical protein